MELLKQFSEKYMKEQAPSVNVGDTVRKRSGYPLLFYDKITGPL